MQQQQHAIEFFFIAEASSLWGFHWLIEWSTSSFYVKCLHPAMQSAKVSLHGPDPKHLGKQHLRFDLDHTDVLEKATKAGSHWSSGSDRLPFYFGGRQVNDHAAHIVRFSAEWNTFIKGAPGPGNSRGPREKSTFRALVRAPEGPRLTRRPVPQHWRPVLARRGGRPCGQSRNGPHHQLHRDEPHGNNSAPSSHVGARPPR